MEDKNFFNRILELMPQPVFCVREGHVLYANHPAKQLFIEPGLPVDELLGGAMEDYAQFEGSMLCLQLLLPGMKMGACVTRMEDLDVFVAEQEHTELQAMALAAMQFRQTLSDALSILSRSDLQIDPSYRGQLNRRLFQMQRLVFNMSDTARYTAEASRSKSYLDAVLVIGELFEKIGALTDRNGIKLVHSCPREMVMTLLNEERLERALYNMVSNAMKVTPSGGTIEAKLTCKGQRLYLSVRDHGPGIPEDVMSTLFTRYLRRPDLNSRQEGLGLGMPLIRATAMDHDGTVLIDHPKDGGTRVTMSLEIRKNPENILRSNVMTIDYAGEQDHGLLELSDLLPSELYSQEL